MNTVARIDEALRRRLGGAIVPGASLGLFPVLAWSAALPESWLPAALLAPDAVFLYACLTLAVACVVLAIDRARLARRIARLEHDVRCDGLTGLLHAGGFAESLRLELQRAHRYHRNLSMLLLDLNDFKRLNDRYGHPAGDRALQFVASSLRGALREVDIVARIGGDEFAVLLPETDLVQAEHVADRLRGLLTTRIPGSECEIGVAIGVATRGPETTAQALYSAADAALYADKRARVTAHEGVATGAIAFAS